jgi:hypothetical protein
MARPRKTMLPKRLYLSMAPKTLYFAELAARAGGKTLAQFIDAVLTDAFEQVYLDDPEMLKGPMYVDATGRITMVEPALKPSASVASMEDSLWADSEFLRLLKLARSEVHWLVSDEEQAALALIQADSNYCVSNENGPQFDVRAIDKDWTAIKAAATKSIRKEAK